MLTPDQPAPEDYYQNNVVLLLRFVRENFPALMHLMHGQDLRQQIDGYLSAGDDAQRLFARLLTRKGPVYRQDKLQYREIHNLSAAVTELTHLHLVEQYQACAADQLLHKLTKAELLNLAPEFARAQIKRLRKPEIIDYFLGRYSDHTIRNKIATDYCWLSLAQPFVWWVVRLLYFGDRVQDWSAFVLQDLGMVRYERVELQEQYLNHPARFAAELQLRQLAALTHRVTQMPALNQPLLAALDTINPEQQDRMLQRRRDQILLQLGQLAERQQEYEQALLAYQRCQRHPARERQVRIYHKLDQADVGNQLLQQIKRSPWCGEERQFGLRFGKRNAGYQPPTDVIEVSTTQPSVEQQVIELLTEQGGWGTHVENSLLRSMTGLIYWPIIFADVSGAFTNPFQSGPNDLYYDDFVQARSELLAQHEAHLAQDEALHRFILQIAREKHPTANRLVNWGLFDETPIEDYLHAIKLADLRRICAYLIRNLNHMRTGLPDLFISYGPQHYELVEVKGPNDQLQPGQRVWLEQLQKMRVPCRVVKLKLIDADPKEDTHCPA